MSDEAQVQADALEVLARALPGGSGIQLRRMLLVRGWSTSCRRALVTGDSGDGPGRAPTPNARVYLLPRGRLHVGEGCWTGFGAEHPSRASGRGGACGGHGFGGGAALGSVMGRGGDHASSLSHAAELAAGEGCPWCR